MLVVLVHAAVTHVLVFSFRADSASMEPALSRGDRVSRRRWPSAYPSGSCRRGCAATASRIGATSWSSSCPACPSAGGTSGPRRRSFVFVTFNRHSLDEGPDGRPIARLSVKRVIGLPGDAVRVERLHALVRPAGHAGFEPEAQIVPGAYIVGPPVTDWPAGLPFGGDSEETTLGPGEYFVLGDNRGRSSDSRSWGVVPQALIKGRTLLRYWPVTRFGRP